MRTKHPIPWFPNLLASKRNKRLPVFLAATTLALVGLPGGAGVFLNIELERVSTDYFYSPTLWTTEPSAGSARVVAGDGVTTVNTWDFRTSSRETHHNVEDMLAQLGVGPWSLTMEPGSPAESTYQFNVDASALGSFSPNLWFNVALIPDGPEGPNDPFPLKPTFLLYPQSSETLQYFRSLTAIVYTWGEGGDRIVDELELPVNATSWTPSITLEPDTDYIFRVRYDSWYFDAGYGVNIDVPSNGEGLLPDEWSGTVSVVNREYLQVRTVPEPLQTTLVVGVGLFAWIAWPRRGAWRFTR